MPPSPYRVFGNPEAVVEGWYWALESRGLRRGQVRPLTLMGRELAIYRGEDGRVSAFDAHCPHMGAHLAEGRVEGNDLRCFFHAWRFDAHGACVEVPSLGGCGLPRARAKAWPAEERYGLIWIWTGPEPRRPLPFVPELVGRDVDWSDGGAFVKNCHPSVLLVNAIDEHHFASVHQLAKYLAADLTMEPQAVDDSMVRFSNTTRVPKVSLLTRFLGLLYRGPLTYSMSYAFASTGTVTLGPDFLHFHILFALRPTPDGRTEGRTVLVTRRRTGPAGWIFNRIVLWITKVVGGYFAGGDTKVFQTIRFHLRNPVKADHAIVDFIRHTEAQKTFPWREDSPSPRPAPEALPRFHG